MPPPTFAQPHSVRRNIDRLTDWTGAISAFPTVRVSIEISTLSKVVVQADDGGAGLDRQRSWGVRSTSMVTIRESLSDILWLGQDECHEPANVGGKAAQLSRLAARWNVPAGFCLTSAAFRRAGDAESLPDALRNALSVAYAQLAADLGQAAPSVAVRSSAVDEDGHIASFAGQHETFLNISGIDDVIAAVERCWASFRTERALEYRRHKGLSSDGIRLAVLVQHMAPADVSGVVFSADPVTGDRNHAVVTASWGLGESIVGGTVTPDTWIVQKDSREIVERVVGDKRRMTVAVPDGSREVDVPRLLRLLPSLTDDQIREMVDLAAALEEQMGWPVDIECAFGGGRLYLLQCRPITSLAPATLAA